jgi:putative transcriptional regulator
VAQYQSSLKEHRERAGLSQEALARQVGVTRQTIVNIEQGRNEPRILLAFAIAAAVGVAISAIDQLFRKALM